MPSPAQRHIRGIVFDLWNTLVYNEHRPNPIVAIGRAFGLGEAPGWTKAIERGMMLRPMSGIEEGITSLSRQFGVTLRGEVLEDLVRLWREACLQTRLFPDVPEAFRRLAVRFPLGLLSNTQSFDLEFLEEAPFPAAAARLLSCHEGLLKPDPALFVRMAKRLGLEPPEILMVGDNLRDDVLGAEAAGMQGVLIRRHEAPLSFQERHPDRTPIPSLAPLLEDLGV
jgi:HAD superfamily hydrolase (TIGR01549 family)